MKNIQQEVIDGNLNPYNLLDLWNEKALDKEDIESLGFEIKTTSYGIYYDNKNYTIKYAWDKKLIISQKDEEGIPDDVFEEVKEYILFMGIIKNKSELKKVLQMLNIDYNERKN